MAEQAPYWIVVWRDRTDRDAPDPDATVFASESDMIGEIADGESWRCEDRVLEVLRVSADGAEPCARDDLDRLCEETLADWEAERQHRHGLMAGAR